MIPGLHADHVDASGAYGQKFAVVKELLETGVLKEIPKEFLGEGAQPVVTQQEVPVVTTTSQVIGGQQDEFDMSNGHADHYDETGRYAKAYEAKYGAGSLDGNVDDNQDSQQTTGNSWKSFLQNIIAEEKSKLKV